MGPFEPYNEIKWKIQIRKFWVFFQCIDTPFGKWTKTHCQKQKVAQNVTRECWGILIQGKEFHCSPEISSQAEFCAKFTQLKFGLC